MSNQEQKCQHRPDNKLDCVAWHLDAERRAARGEKQKFCVACKKWIWKSLWKKGRKKFLD